MAEAMAPRGPDAAGVWSQGRVALGHRRLKIIDLSEAGAQPMVDSDLGLAVCWNGCIYNYKDLRHELIGQGYRFFSHSDTEVLLKAYHLWGDRFVDRLKGMFAFAIVERDSGRVLLGRDRLGIKPLYLTEDAHRIRFASSLPALLAGGGVDTRIDPRRPAPLPVFPFSRAAAAHDFVRRDQGAAGIAGGDRARRTAVPPPRIGNPTSRGARSGPTGPNVIGRTRFSRRCASRSSVGWWPTCPSGACSRAASTPA